MSIAPFDDIRALLADLPAPLGAHDPEPALGQLGALAAFMKAWRGQSGVNRPIVALYAGSGGADPDGVRARLEAVAGGAAPVAQAAQAVGAGLEAFDLAIERPVGDMVAGAAMSERECAATMAFGMEALSKQPDLLLPAVITDDGDDAAAAVALALFGGAPADWSATSGARIAAAVARLHAEVGADPDPLEILRHLGGRQMAAVAGAIVAARVQRVPVLLDGYAACAAAAALQRAQPGALDHCRAGHRSAQHGPGALLQRMGLRPILDLGLEGEGGLGSVAAIGVLRAAAAVGG